MICISACLAGLRAPCHNADDGAWRRLAVIGGLTGPGVSPSSSHLRLAADWSVQPAAGMLLQQVWNACSRVAGAWSQPQEMTADPTGSVRAAALSVARRGVQAARSSVGPVLEPVLRALVSAAEDALGSPPGTEVAAGTSSGMPVTFASSHSGTLLREAIQALEQVVEGASITNSLGGIEGRGGSRGEGGPGVGDDADVPVVAIAAALGRVLVPLLHRWIRPGVPLLRHASLACRGQRHDVSGAMTEAERGMQAAATILRADLVMSVARLLNAVCASCPLALLVPLGADVVPRTGDVWTLVGELVETATTMGRATARDTLAAALRGGMRVGAADDPWAMAAAGLRGGGGRVPILLLAVAGMTTVLVAGGNVLGAQPLHKVASAIRYLGEA